MTRLQTLLWPGRPWPAAAALAALVALMIALVAAGLWWAPLALLAALGAGWLALTRLEAIPALVVFGLYLNLPVLATRFHGAPAPLAMAFFGLLALPVAVRVMLRREPLHVDATLLTMLVLLASFAPSIMVARDPVIGLEKMLKYAFEGVMIYLLLLNAIRGEAELRTVLWALLAAAAISSAVVIHQELTQDFTNIYGGLAQRHAEFKVGAEWRDRAAGPIGDPNYYAQALLIPLPVAVAFCFIERGWRGRLLAAAAAGLIIAAVGLTYSRGGAIGMAAVLIMIALLMRVRLPVILAAGLSILLLLSVVSPEFFGRVASIGDVRHVASTEGNVDRSFRGRLGENLAAWNVFIDHPVFGVGPDNFALYYQEYADELGMAYHAENRIAHNLYLNVAADLGLVGLLLTMAVMVVPIFQLWGVYRAFYHTRPFLAKTAAALGTAHVGYLITGVLLTLAYERYFWCLLALAGSASLLGRLAKQEAARA